MRIKQLLTKTLLVAAGLCVGASAWGAGTTTVTYDFTSYTARTLSNSGTKGFQANGVSHYYASNLPEVYNRFAFQFAGTFSIESAGLYAQRTNGDHVGIMGLANGDKVTINFSQGAIMVRGSITSWTGNTTDWTSYTTGTEIPIAADGNLSFQAKTSCKISSIVIETSTIETMTTPSISSEASGSERTVTITDGVSNIFSGVTTYYTTDGSAPTASSTKYTAPFNVSESTTVKAITISNSSAKTESTIAEQYIDLDVVDTPTATLTAVDGKNRTITFACTTDGATLSYAVKNGEDTWTDFITANSVVISANTTLKVKATKGSKEAVSEPYTFDAGTAIVLNAPTYTIGSYSDGSYTLTLATDQTSKLLSPTAKINYTINDGVVTEVVSGSNVAVAVGVTLKMWSTADGYTKSDDVILTATYIDISTYRTDWTTNFKTLAGTILENKSNSSGSVTLSSEELVSGYYNITNEGFNSKFGVNNVNWQVRYYGSTKEANTGLWPYNVNGSMVITELTAGDVIVFTGDAVTAGTNVTKDVFMSTANSNSTFVVSANGNATFTPTKSGYIYSVTVYTQRPASVSPSVTDYATFSSPYALDFASATGVKAYIASAASNSAITMTKVTGAVPAKTGLLLQKTEGEISIPTAATGTAPATNYLKAGTGAKVATDVDYFRYVLAGTGDATSFYNLASEVEIPEGKAYLEVPASVVNGARLSLMFADEATGIGALLNDNVEMMNIYSLSGQRVSQPTKGLYIVNGKKVIKK